MHPDHGDIVVLFQPYRSSELALTRGDIFMVQPTVDAPSHMTHAYLDALHIK
jgi:hypothetical protein